MQHCLGRGMVLMGVAQRYLWLTLFDFPHRDKAVYLTNQCLLLGYSDHHLKQCRLDLI